MGKAYADFRPDYNRGLSALLNTLLPKRRYRDFERREPSATKNGILGRRLNKIASTELSELSAPNYGNCCHALRAGVEEI